MFAAPHQIFPLHILEGNVAQSVFRKPLTYPASAFGNQTFAALRSSP